MKFAIASGKGGTGKTTVSASLVLIWENPVIAVDLDVEEPNLHLFLKPKISASQTAKIQIPRIDESKCTYCGKCRDICQFKAICVLANVLLIFPEMCHGCGGCIAVCPESALSTGSRVLGEISWGNRGRIRYLMGRLRIGEAMSPPLMRAVKDKLESGMVESKDDVIIDAPPGVSCPAVNAVMDSDGIILVTEPTPFGLYDLRLAHKAFAMLEIPMGVVVNRAGIDFSSLYDYCADSGLPILAEIPYDRRIAEAYSNGYIISEYAPAFRNVFVDLSKKMNSMISQRAHQKEAIGV